MRIANVLLGLIAFTGPSSAWSQDLITVAPDAATVEYEDARVRVLRLRIAPNASLPMHDRPARVVISLTPNDVRISHADGTTRTTRTAADRAAWSEPTRRAVTNLANSTLENIIVELKTASAPAKTADPPRPTPPEYLAEPRHHRLFENQYARVYDVRIPSGETTEFHRHAHDAVTVFVSGGLVAIQVQGEPWGKTEKIVPGVAFSADAKKPVVHRVRNDGTSEYHVILVQLLPSLPMSILPNSADSKDHITRFNELFAGAAGLSSRLEGGTTLSMRMPVATLATCLLLQAIFAGKPHAQADVFDRVQHGHAVSDGGVKIHYATLGSGPLVVMIHGFPDFWYTWRHQMEALSGQFQTVAIDQRGYNLSDKPKGVESYDMRLLVADVAAVIRHLGKDKATIVGHDWGGMVAWQFAMNLPQMTENLVILNLPHPAGLLRELKSNPEQIANSEYARTFQRGSPGDPKVFFGNPMTPQTLSGWVRDPAARRRYVEAFERSDFEAMLNYYKRNYPAGSGAEAPPVPPLPQVKVPVLMFHGLDDRALHRNGLAGTWDWVEKDLTLVTVPGAGHFVQQDAPELVTSTIKWWLTMRSRL